MSSKSASQIFKILFQTGDINTFVLVGVFFSRYVKLSRDVFNRVFSIYLVEYLVEKLLKINMANY